MFFTKIPIIVLLITTLACTITIGPLKTLYVRKHIKNDRGYLLYIILVHIVICLVICIVEGFKFDLSLYSVILGIVLGLIAMAYDYLLGKSVKIGPWSYTYLINNFSTIFTSLSGFLFFGNPAPSVYDYVGMILVVLSMILSVNFSKKGGNTVNLKWFILAILAMLFNASVGIIQLTHQTSSHSSELMGFLLITHFVSTVSALVLYFVRKGGNENMSSPELPENSESERKDKKLLFGIIILLLFLGLLNAVVSIVNLYLAGAMDSMVFFPVTTGVPLMTTVIFSFVLFKEKLAKNQIVGLVVGITGVVFLFL